LEAGIAYVDVARGLNTGIAEANMMSIGEAFAALGYNAWVSTFCPFFDWKVLRRICIGYQERQEAIASPDGWLSEGHGLDLTFVATAANLDTKTNGATHMGNDDVTLFGQLAQLKIIDVSCPRQLLAIVRWIAEGSKGLVYLRIMRDGSVVLYPDDFVFEYGKGYVLAQSPDEKAVILSSGRQAHESLAAAKLLAKEGLPVGVVDMPSVDEEVLLSLYGSGKKLILAEQNNGYILQNLLRVFHKAGHTVDFGRVIAVNTTGESMIPHYIHSGTYQELTEAYDLSPELLAEHIRSLLC
jgi:transketolase C-terminal domain/subunit